MWPDYFDNPVRILHILLRAIANRCSIAVRLRPHKDHSNPIPADRQGFYFHEMCLHRVGQ